MADWLLSMSQTFEFYEIDPNTWKDKRRISSILSCSIKRDLSSDTLESASFRTTEVFGECYIRVYLITIQNGIKEKFPLGTFLVQTPSVSFDGKIRTISMDAFSPLLELKDGYPELGFTVMKNANVMDNVANLTTAHLRAPVIGPTKTDETLYDNFTAEETETWLDYLLSLMANANYNYELDEIGRVLFAPAQDTASLQPRFTFTDDNSSILYPDIEDRYDLYGVPNVVEVVYSGDKGDIIYSKIVNDDPTSPTSTVTRGREVVHREKNPSITGIPNQVYLDQYATQLLKKLSSVEHTVSFSHGYCPVRIGDCVRLNYQRADLRDIKAKITTQNIECVSGCKITATAVYTVNLWKE